jgi:hypothetical protein
VSQVPAPKYVQAAADARGFGSYVKGFRRRPSLVAPLIVVVCWMVISTSPGFGWSSTLWILGSVVLVWFVLDTVRIVVRHDGVYLHDKGLVDTHGFFGLSLTRKVPWDSVRSIDYQHRLYTVNLLPFLRRRYCDIHYLRDGDSTVSGEFVLRLSGRIVDLEQAVALIRTRTGIRQ